MHTIFDKAREPVNSATHFLGAVLSVAGTFALVQAALHTQSTRLVLAGLLFGLSLVALYASSALYHYVRCSAAALLRLRKLDHAMIFVLIAGTYTPLFLSEGQGAAGVRYTAAIWAVALGGIVLKMVWMGAPRWLSTLLYLGMGWFILLDFPLLAALPAGCLLLLLAGGLSYTVGAVIYGLKKPNFSPRFGFHELFHVLVILGSLLHFLAIYLYLF